MTKKEYYNFASSINDTKWLSICADNPSKQMTRIHVAIIKLVLRKRQAD